MSTETEPLIIALDAAVPLHVLLMRDWPEHRRINEARWAAQVVAAKGDVLQFGGRGAAHAFNALAKGLAVAAYAPGGVTFSGRHWCVDHTVCLRADEPAPPASARRSVVDLEMPV